MSDPTTPDQPADTKPPAGAKPPTRADLPARETPAATTEPAAQAKATPDAPAAPGAQAGAEAAPGGKVTAGGEAGAADDTVEIGKVTDEKLAGVKPASENAAGDRPAGDKAAGEAAGKPVGEKGAGDKPAGDKAAGGAAAGGPTGEKAVGGDGVGGKKRRRFGIRRGPWLTVGGVVVVLGVLAVLGYVWGLGPMNRLNAQRGITPPAKLGGLDRITDQDIRDELQLNQTRERLSEINDGKQVTVEAYGSLDGDRLYVLIALRGKVDIDKTVADSGATPEQIKKVGRSTCVETGDLPTQCYRGSNTLTIIAQSGNDGITVDEVAPVAEEAFNAMK
ncbi:hypothetical protein [Kribbella sp. CA-247076]|uniref:hypothetical protein n=1 Tax=Kribbella sp. CA-247076 TaxID=3239941 RepID=UPI003D8B6DA6